MGKVSGFGESKHVLWVLIAQPLVGWFLSSKKTPHYQQRQMENSGGEGCGGLEFFRFADLAEDDLQLKTQLIDSSLEGDDQ